MTLTKTLAVSSTHPTDGVGPASATDWELTANNHAGSEVAGTTGVAEALPRGDFALSEAELPMRPTQEYTLDHWTCVDDDTGATVPVVGSSVSLSRTDQRLTCTALNRFTPPHLTLVKNVHGGTASADQWQLVASGPTPLSGLSGSTPVTDVTVASGGYTLSESPVSSPGPANYVAGLWQCAGGGTGGGGVTLTLGANEDVICTLTNTYEAPAPGPDPNDPGQPGGPGGRLPWTGWVAAGVMPLAVLIFSVGVVLKVHRRRQSGR
jgi:hypothetical protein